MLIMMTINILLKNGVESLLVNQRVVIELFIFLHFKPNVQNLCDIQSLENLLDSLMGYYCFQIQQLIIVLLNYQEMVKWSLFGY